MLSDLPQGIATQVDGDEKVMIELVPDKGQMHRLNLGPDKVQGHAYIRRLPDFALDGVKNPEPANLIDEENGIYKGVLSDRSYKVDG